MVLCLSCFHLSPGGALYCSACGKSLGCKVCAKSKKAHRNPLYAHRCMACGSEELTEPTLYLPLGWLVHLLAWVGTFYLLKWLGPPLLEMASGTLQGAAHRSLGEPHHAIGHWLNCVLSWLILLGVLYFGLSFVLSLFPGEADKHLRRALARTLGVSLRLVAGVARGVFAVLWRIIEGNPNRANKT
jgi:hypothetical protein